MSNPRPPISWVACPYCGAGRHQRCRRPSGLTYPLGTFHKDRVAARNDAADVSR